MVPRLRESRLLPLSGHAWILYYGIRQGQIIQIKLWLQYVSYLEQAVWSKQWRHDWNGPAAGYIPGSSHSQSDGNSDKKSYFISKCLLPPLQESDNEMVISDVDTGEFIAKKIIYD